MHAALRHVKRSLLFTTFRPQAQLVEKDAEISDLKAANDQLRALCIRLQSALEYSSEQLHAVSSSQGKGLWPSTRYVLEESCDEHVVSDSQKQAFVSHEHCRRSV